MSLIKIKSTITADKLKAIVTALRWEIETGGLTLADGTKVLTGIEDQNRVYNAFKGNELAGIDRVMFKGPDGSWAWITLEQLRAIAIPMAQHTASCFNAEGAHHLAIDALVEQHKDDPAALQAALDNYDESQGWPT